HRRPPHPLGAQFEPAGCRLQQAPRCRPGHGGLPGLSRFRRFLAARQAGPAGRCRHGTRRRPRRGLVSTELCRRRRAVRLPAAAAAAGRRHRRIHLRARRRTADEHLPDQRRPRARSAVRPRAPGQPGYRLSASAGARGRRISLSRHGVEPHRHRPAPRSHLAQRGADRGVAALVRARRRRLVTAGAARLLPERPGGPMHRRRPAPTGDTGLREGLRPLCRLLQSAANVAVHSVRRADAGHSAPAAAFAGGPVGRPPDTCLREQAALTGISRARVVGWLSFSAADAAGRLAIQLGSTIILARLLAPEDFGRTMLVLVAVQTLILLVQAGFEEALVQREEVTPEHLATAFWTVTALGAALAALCWAAAGVFAATFD